MTASVASSQDEQQSVDTVSSLREKGLQVWGALRSSSRRLLGNINDDDETLEEMDESAESAYFQQLLEREAKEKARQARAEARREREEERRFAQFKKDEAFVMKYMNEKLEQEMKQLERKRLAKEKQEAKAKELEARTKELEAKKEERAKESVAKKEERAKELAHKRNLERQSKLRTFLANENHQAKIIAAVLKTNNDASGKSPCKFFHMEDASDLTAATAADDSLDSQEDESSQEEEKVAVDTSLEQDYNDDNHQKTIRWCTSIDEELERRKVARAKYPTAPGGMARRVRRLPKTPVEKILDKDVNGTAEEVQDMITDYLNAMVEDEDEAMEDGVYEDEALTS